MRFVQKHEVRVGWHVAHGFSWQIVCRRPVVSAPLPQSETKNTIVHGSQTDSGIFTLGSLPNSTPSANQQTTYSQAYPM